MKEKYQYPIIDILLIEGHNKIGKWQHPRIKKLINKYCVPSDINAGYYDGNIIRACYKDFTIVALLTNDVYQKFLDECFSNKTSNPLAHTDLHQFIAVMILEDVWIPGDEQFCFTEYGKKISELFSYDTPYEFISPDLGLRLDDDSGSSWGYCT
jgi:hypothetical protein